MNPRRRFVPPEMNFYVLKIEYTYTFEGIKNMAVGNNVKNVATNSSV